MRRSFNWQKEKGAILYYDVNFRPSHRNDLLKATPNMIDNLELADIVRGSDEDFGVIYGQRDADKVYKSEISFYCKNFICTQGERPAIIHSAGGLRKNIQFRRKLLSAQSVQVIISMPASYTE